MKRMQVKIYIHHFRNQHSLLLHEKQDTVSRRIPVSSLTYVDLR